MSGFHAALSTTQRKGTYKTPIIRARFLVMMLAIACTLGTTGCGPFIWEKVSDKPVDLGVAPHAGQWSNSAAVRDTIGALAFYDGTAGIRVRGYGLVIGLGENGSRECPKRVREQLVEMLYKQRFSVPAEIGEKQATPEQLIDSRHTAVVMVQGTVSIANSMGRPFDVTVTALPGTQTKSLMGGLLATTDLQIFRRSAGKTISGKVLARANGPLFLNPFAGGDAATKISPLQATVLGGGKALMHRELRLVLSSPSYLWVRKIQERINAKFPADPPIAKAISPSFIKLTIPHDYADDTGHFLSLVRATFLSADPRFEAVRTQQLGQELVSENAPHALISLAMESIGQTALSVLSKLYAHPKPHVRFYAAMAGLRLGDHIAADSIALIAQDPLDPNRFNAIRALGGAKGMAVARFALRRLLNDEDPRIQIAAYEALSDHADTAITRQRVGADNFVLDHIPSARSTFIYAKRTQSRKIVLFGEKLLCNPPIFYRSPNGSLTINAQSSDKNLTLLRRVTSTGRVSPPVIASRDLDELIMLLGSQAGIGAHHKIVGLGLDYSTVVRAIYHLCTDGAINARLMWEQPNVAELFGPARPTGRPESEL